MLHLGRTGAGPRLARSIVRELHKRADLQVHFGYSSASDTVRQNRDLPVSKLELLTYTDKWSFLRALLRSPWTAQRLRRFIRVNEIDVVVSPMWNPLQLVLLQFVRRIPYVSCVHDAQPHPGDGRAYAALLPLEVRRARSVVTFSTAVASALRGRFPGKRILETVHGAFTDDGTRRVEEPSSAERVRVGMFGRLSRYQGVDRFVDAIGLLRADGLEFDAVIAGKGDTEVVELARTSADIDWRLGWIAEDEVNSTVAGFDVLALPYSEASQSGVFAVAIAEGVPIVATPVGGLVQQVTESGAGVLSDDLSSSSFAAAMKRLIVDPELRRSASDSGQRAARTIYGWQAAGDVIEGEVRRIRKA